MDRNELRSALLRLMGGKGYRPMNKSELSRDLSLPSNDRPLLRSELAAMTREGLIAEGRKGRYELPKHPGHDKLRGTIKFLPRGHAWFYPDATDPDNVATGIDLKKYSRVHIPRRDTGTALEGDRVIITFHLPKPAPWKQRGRRPVEPEEEPDARGKVEKVLERRSGRIVGTFCRKAKFIWVETEDPALSGQIDIFGDTTAEPGQLVVVDLDQWEKHRTPRGRILEVLGWPGQAGVDIAAVIHRHGLRTSFPEDVLAETRAVPEEVDPNEVARREDWRDRLVITIDPADAKDHDDAVHAEPDTDEKNVGGVIVTVAIADVAAYVRSGTTRSGK